jgi:hypothetical protein
MSSRRTTAHWYAMLACPPSERQGTGTKACHAMHSKSMHRKTMHRKTMHRSGEFAKGKSNASDEGAFPPSFHAPLPPPKKNPPPTHTNAVGEPPYRANGAGQTLRYQAHG